MIVVHGVPLYWGIETEPTDRSLVTKATLHEVLPPYRLSRWAFRIRVSPWHWLHLGVFEYDDAVGRYGLYFEPDEIAEWRGPRVAQEDADGTAGAPDADPV